MTVSAAIQASAGSTLAAFRLDGMSAVVTGASRGLGRGCALALAAAGADVAVLGRTRADLVAVAGEIEALGRKSEILECDVTRLAEARSTLSRLPRIDVLVNNAGGNKPQPFLDVTEDTYDRIFNVNMRSVFFLTQAAVQGMIARGIRGSIVNMSSQAGHVALRDRTVYCATKHALEGFTKTVAVELAPYGIRVNTVAPTFVETPMTAPMLANGEFADYVHQRIPLGRLGSIGDVAAAVLYLASPASGLVTGTSLRVDGGWTAQ